MAEFGAEVACADIDEEKAQETVDIISHFGHRAVAIKADVSRQDEIKHMVNRTVDEFGTIHIVFANAGIPDSSKVRIHEKPVDDFDKVMALNLRGTFLLMQAVLPIMMKNRGGSFISTASVGGLSTTPASSLNEGHYRMITAYTVSKAGVIMLTKMAAKQYGEYGIRVNAICPGVHRTPMSMPTGEEKTPMIQMKEEILPKLTPLGRIGLPEELKGLAIWLASDASSFATGQTFVQDGGLIA
jgi:NAD(P)-dependent dehydrogenase (short-subunit alcohol dehydrogenase family)